MNAQTNHDGKETTTEIELSIEELEEVIAPMVQQDFHKNHNETLVRDTRKKRKAD